jgi:carboxypeptidase family protein
MVTLSLSDYNRLVDLANAPAAPPDVAPVPAALSRADLRIRVEGETARGVFTLSGDVLRTGTTRVPLISSATVLDARADGRVVPLVADGAVHSAVLAGPGAFTVVLDWGAPITFTPGRALFTLPSPPAGSVTAVIDVAGEQASVQVTPGIVTRRTAAGGRTIVEATLDPGAPSQVSWSIGDRAPATTPREERTLADVLTLVTLGESDVRMASLVDVTVVQGEPRTIQVRLPAGYDMTGVTGTSVQSSRVQNGMLTLDVSDPLARRHQVLLTLERAHADGSFTLDTAMPSVVGAQRERGEVAIEGIGTLELSTPDRDGLHRVDVRELNRALVSLARHPLLSGFRYQNAAAAARGVPIDVKRFADAAVLAAVAERAVATTLLTAEGRMLTEVSMWIRNRAQPFLKVLLPAGASIVSVDVAGEPAKPVVGADGSRVPLLRPGFRPTGPYAVSFVYVHAGPALGKSGEVSVTLPKIDIPVGLVEWELFVPDRYRVRKVGGNMMRAEAYLPEPSASPAVATGLAQPATLRVTRGQIVGRATDPSGGALPGATIELESGGSIRASATTDVNGVFVLSNVPSGPVSVNARLEGFRASRRPLVFDQRPRQVDFVLAVATITETVTVRAETPPVIDGPEVRFAQTPPPPRAAAPTFGIETMPSQNVVNLQRRAAGVLPVRIDVPRAGTSHRFAKVLVVDDTPTASIRYSRR